MNQYAQIMFEMLDHHIDSQADRICSGAISQLRADITVEQRQALRAEIRQELETLAWSFFGTFDNVGCGLPDEVLGYSIIIRPSNRVSTEEVDMRDEETDYADMWLDFLHDKRAK